MVKINMSPSREKYPLSKKKIIKKTIGSLLGYSIFFAAIWFTIAVFNLSEGSSGTGVTESAVNPFAFLNVIFPWLPYIYIVLTVIVYFYQKWYFEVYYYDIKEDYLVIKKGPIAPKEITIPWERIQDVYVDQDVLDRLFRIYDVHLSTATIASGIAAHIDGVEVAGANGLRKELLDKIKDRISRQK